MGRRDAAPTALGAVALQSRPSHPRPRERAVIAETGLPILLSRAKKLSAWAKAVSTPSAAGKYRGKPIADADSGICRTRHSLRRVAALTPFCTGHSPVAPVENLGRSARVLAVPEIASDISRSTNCDNSDSEDRLSSITCDCCRRLARLLTNCEFCASIRSLRSGTVGRERPFQSFHRRSVRLSLAHLGDCFRR
jgi:hypothetical protein